MFLDTHTYETMEEAICKYLNTDKESLTALFESAGNLAQKEYYFDMDIFNNKLLMFLECNKPMQNIDEILFFHLSRRLDIASEDIVGRNLEELLVEKSCISEFLNKYEIKFVKGIDHIKLYYKGYEISLEDTFKSHVPYLRSRLGYNKGREDYCFNGFAFRDNLLKNDYARTLFYVPEFIGSLASFLRVKGLIEEYSKCSHFYCMEYCVPIENVLFDENDTMGNEEKQNYLLLKILQRLYEYSVTHQSYMYDRDNPILRLKDNESMDAKYFVSKEVITSEMLR